MFLYDKKDKCFDVYDFTASRNDLVDYRMIQMEKIPKDEKVFIAETRVGHYGDIPLFEMYTSKTYDDSVVPASFADDDSEEKKSNGYRCYHFLKSDRRSNRIMKFC